MQLLHGLGLIGREVRELLVLVQVDAQLRDRRLLLRHLRSTHYLVYWLYWYNLLVLPTKAVRSEIADSCSATCAARLIRLLAVLVQKYWL